MLRCPFCDADLTSTFLSSGRCPECGSLLSWESESVSEDSSPTGDASASQAAKEPSPEQVVHAGGVTDQTYAPIDSGRGEPLLPLEAGPGAEPPTTDHFAAQYGESADQPPHPSREVKQKDTTYSNQGRETIVPRDLSPDELSHITNVWGKTFTPEDTPLMTLKTDPAAAEAAISSLLVQPRRVSRASDPTSEPSDYELIETIGEGGVGVVYSALQASIDRVVAVKMLKSETKDVRQEQIKFAAEAVVTGDLEHPNIVPIYELGSSEDGSLFYSMKQVQGTPWLNVIGEKTLSENIEILMKVIDAVAFAHARGVIHRDLKPENVMLGDYGEVMVMDWGIAVTNTNFSKINSVTSSTGLGGTPAYMSPEMILGPLEKIGPASDVYLLGGLLYEIITGQPPHAGSTVTECLQAATRNVIQSTDETGELINIALEAMATEPEDRFASVTDFQAAIREYESHSESIALTERAKKDLAQAEKTNDYQDYARSLFAYQEAIAMWKGNTRAHQELSTAKLAYAGSALQKGDYDLGMSLLDESIGAHKKLHRKLASAQAERDARQQRLKAFKLILGLLVVLVFAVVSMALVYINNARKEAVLSEEKAVLSQEEAESARDDAQESERGARDSERNAKLARDAAIQARQDEELAKKEAVKQTEKAEQARQLAEAATEAEQYESYIAQIGLAAEKVNDNAFDDAVRLLRVYENSPLRHWEWGRLWYLCNQSFKEVETAAEIDVVAFSPDGKLFATGSRDGKVNLWETKTGRNVRNINLGLYVHAIAFSPDGRHMATGGDDGVVRIWDVRNVEKMQAPSQVLNGHEDDVLSAVYSQDGKLLLTTSLDRTARLWDVATGRLIQTLNQHNWWVWDAAFSPDQKRIATAGQDGKVIVWKQQSNSDGGKYENETEFTGHRGPVYSVIFSPDGVQIVSGGYDKRVLIWKHKDVKPIDIKKRIQETYKSSAVEFQPQPPPPFRAFDGHTAAVRCLDFSGDGNERLIVSGSHDNTVRVWNADTGKLVKILRGHGGWVRSCAFSPDGRFVLSGSHDHRAMLWSISGYAETRVLQERVLRGHSDAILSAAFDQTGTRVVTSSRDRTARIWNLQSGEVKVFEEGHQYLASNAVFFPDGKKLLTSAIDNTVRLWDVPSGSQLLLLKGTGQSAAMALSPDATRILTGSSKQKSETVWKAQLFDAANGRLVQSLDGHPAEVTAVAFSADKQWLFTGDTNGRCRLWRWDSGDGVWKERWNRRRHTRSITAAVFLPDSRTLLTASLDKTVGNWDVATGNERESLILRHADSVTSMSVSTDGREVLTICTDPKQQLWHWNIAGAKLIRVFDVGDEPVHSASFSPNERIAVTANSETSTVRLWNLEKGSEIRRPGGRDKTEPYLRCGGSVWSVIFTPDGKRILTIGGNNARMWDRQTARQIISFSPHRAVASANFSPGGTHIITGSWDNSAKVWNVKTGKSEFKLEGEHTGSVNSAVFSPIDENTVLTAGDDATAKLWIRNRKTGSWEVKTTFHGHRDSVRSAVFSADGRTILTASDDRTARIWDVRQGDRPLFVLAGHTASVLSAAFSSDGLRVVTGSADKTAKIWNAQNGKELLKNPLQGHTAGVTSVAFSPDHKRVLTGSLDSTATLWDAETGKEILTLKGHDRPVTSVVFSPNGQTVLTGSRDGTAILWPAVDWKKRRSE